MVKESTPFAAVKKVRQASPKASKKERIEKTLPMPQRSVSPGGTVRLVIEDDEEAEELNSSLQFEDDSHLWKMLDEFAADMKHLYDCPHCEAGNEVCYLTGKISFRPLKV